METAASVQLVQPKETETIEIKELYRLFSIQKAAALVGPDGESITIPESIYNVLRQVISHMSQGRAVSVSPIMQELTSQQAANMLGVSRPFLVGLLTNEEIPHHKTGTHRRIYLKDLIAYREKRDKNRNRILGEMALRDVEDGTYDKIYVPTEDE
ncbi:MAG: helix-turn-helix domain-containing protein [Bryobacteraceae bacterium]